VRSDSLSEFFSSSVTRHIILPQTLSVRPLVFAGLTCTPLSRNAAMREAQIDIESVVSESANTLPIFGSGLPSIHERDLRGPVGADVRSISCSYVRNSPMPGVNGSWYSAEVLFDTILPRILPSKTLAPVINLFQRLICKWRFYRDQCILTRRHRLANSPSRAIWTQSRYLPGLLPD
jgi:hypothetical protein